MSFAVLNKLSVVIKKTLLFYFLFFKDDPGFSITFKMKNKTPNCERMINALLTASANKAEYRAENMKDERTVSERWTHDGRINNAQLADRKRTKQYECKRFGKCMFTNFIFKLIKSWVMGVFAKWYLFFGFYSFERIKRNYDKKWKRSSCFYPPET